LGRTLPCFPSGTDVRSPIIGLTTNLSQSVVAINFNLFEMTKMKSFQVHAKAEASGVKEM
jgi:hypothetical protein